LKSKRDGAGRLSLTPISQCRALSSTRITGQAIPGGHGRYKFGSGLGIEMSKIIYTKPPIIVKELAEQIGILQSDYCRNR
jgi:hypothetical protein